MLVILTFHYYKANIIPEYKIDYKNDSARFFVK